MRHIQAYLDESFYLCPQLLGRVLRCHQPPGAHCHHRLLVHCRRGDHHWLDRRLLLLLQEEAQAGRDGRRREGLSGCLTNVEGLPRRIIT